MNICSINLMMVSIFTTMIVPVAYLQCMMILAIISFLFFGHYRKNNQILRNLPLLGLLPEVLLNFQMFHDKVAKVLEKSKGTLLIKARWLSQNDILLTSDPENVQYMISANFSRYAKGAEWRKRFDIFGDHGVFNSDFEEWKHQRKAVRGFLSHMKFHRLIAKIIPDIIEKGLIPVLEFISEQDVAVDLQELFKRYAFDFASIIATGCNPNSLSIGFPEYQFAKAMDDACEAIFFRHIMPESIWKFQRWLGIGKERKLSQGWKTIDHFLSKLISIRREEVSKAMTKTEDEESFNVLNIYLTGHDDIAGLIHDDKVMRDNLVGIIFAGEDTTSTALSWFFWLISENPFAIINIREEIKRNLPEKDVNKRQLFHLDELGKLVYLHASLCETLRLYPSIPYETRTPTQADTLPSGHNVNEKTTIAICTYAMGRMASIWGEDCHEFKPERWITEDGRIKHEPPHKFFAFSTRPRICPGKDIAFTLMKAIAAAIIHNYDILVLESLPVIPNLSISLRMKHGLMARVKSRLA